MFVELGLSPFAEQAPPQRLDVSMSIRPSPIVWLCGWGIQAYQRGHKSLKLTIISPFNEGCWGGFQMQMK
jgi:hypothetical protein